MLPTKFKPHHRKISMTLPEGYRLLIILILTFNLSLLVEEVIRQNKNDDNEAPEIFQYSHLLKLKEKAYKLEPQLKATPPAIQDDFADLEKILEGKIDEKFSKNIIDDFDESSEATPTLGALAGIVLSENATNLEKFHFDITKTRMYSDNTRVEEILKDLSKLAIVNSTQKDGGTQFKLSAFLENGDQVMMKTKRHEIEDQTGPNSFYFDEIERHNAEIAGFHVDKVLGFRRAMPTVGRVINITSDIYVHASKKFLRTFYIGDFNDLCFHGKCEFMCDTAHAICGNKDMLEVSMSAYLPSFEKAQKIVYRHPWRRSYNKIKKANWESDGDYCSKFRDLPRYKNNTQILNLMDLAILDFLIDNPDRHHYEMFTIFGEDAFPIHLDMGKGFGRAFSDDATILAPLLQCCLVRGTTLETLLRFHNGPVKLSDAVRESMRDDLTFPVIWEPHFAALDRRVGVVLQGVRDCLGL